MIVRGIGKRRKMGMDSSDEPMVDLVAWFRKNFTPEQISELCERLSSNDRDDDPADIAVDRAHPWLRRPKPVSAKAFMSADADLTKLLGGLAANRVL